MQNPLNLNTVNSSKALVPQQSDSGGNVMTSMGGLLSALNITAAAVVKAAPGRLSSISVLVSGTAVGSANDAATVAAAAATNQVFVIPDAIGKYDVDWPCNTGIVVTPGTGQTIAVSYS